MQNPLVALSNQLAATVEAASRHVAAIRGPRGSASAILWDRNTLISAEHAVPGGGGFSAILPDGSLRPAALTARDPGTDVALYRVEDAAPAAPLTPATARPGNLALVIGRSADTGLSASLGVVSIVSGPWTTWRGGQFEEFLRLDVARYPHASGGLAVDAQGHLLGMATCGLSRTGCVTIPSAALHRITGDLAERGHVRRGYLGLGLQPVPLPEAFRARLDTRQSAGLIVVTVEPGGPAEQSGIVVGDILVALDAKAVEDTADVLAALGPGNLGRVLKASLFRGGVPLMVELTVGERPRQET